MSGETKAAIINGRFAVIAATIGGICTIVGAVIGAFLNSKLENNNLNIIIKNSEEFISLQTKYDNLYSEYSTIMQENKQLQSKVESLNNNISQYELYAEENDSLKEEIKNLENILKVFELTTESSIPNNEILHNENYFFIETTDSKVNVRTEPDTSSNIIIRVEESGTKLQAIEKAYGSNHDWYKIIIDNKFGYIMADYVQIIE